jgi:hypothetical protein
MTDKNETVDLWGEIITEPIRTPLTILREQATFLEKNTNGILTGEIRSDIKGGSFTHYFYVKAPSLSYSYLLFAVDHSLTLFPANISKFDDSESYISSISNIKDEKEFINELKGVIQSPRTQKITSALISQSTGV